MHFVYNPGMKSFFSNNNLILLNLLYSNPERDFYFHEIGRILKKQPGTFQRSLNRLVSEGLVKSEFRANARYFRANTDHPLFQELKKIVEKTAGVEIRLRHLLRRWRDVKMAFLYGSYTKNKIRPDSDIDLFVVGPQKIENQLLRGIPPP